jgi:hypothetical protein
METNTSETVLYIANARRTIINIGYAFPTIIWKKYITEGVTDNDRLITSLDSPAKYIYVHKIFGSIFEIRAISDVLTFTYIKWCIDVSRIIDMIAYWVFCINSLFILFWESAVKRLGLFCKIWKRVIREEMLKFFRIFFRSIRLVEYAVWSVWEVLATETMSTLDTVLEKGGILTIRTVLWKSKLVGSLTIHTFIALFRSIDTITIHTFLGILHIGEVVAILSISSIETQITVL